MPIKRKQNNERFDSVIIEKIWIEIPVQSNKLIPNMTNSYMVPAQVAEYIELLESHIIGKLPKLRIEES